MLIINNEKLLNNISEKLVLNKNYNFLNCATCVHKFYCESYSLCKLSYEIKQVVRKEYDRKNYR